MSASPKDMQVMRVAFSAQSFAPVACNKAVTIALQRHDNRESRAR
jgi:hypothetical protein